MTHTYEVIYTDESGDTHTAMHETFATAADTAAYEFELLRPSVAVIGIRYYLN